MALGSTLRAESIILINISLTDNHTIHMLWLHLLSDLNSGITQSRQIQRLANTNFPQQAAGQQLLRRSVGNNSAILENYNSINTAEENILQPVFYYDNCFVCLLMKHIYQIDSMRTGLRIKICQRLIK